MRTFLPAYIPTSRFMPLTMNSAATHSDVKLADPPLQRATKLPAFESIDNAPVGERPPRLTTKRLAIATISALAAAAFTAFTYHWWTVGRFSQSTDDAYVGGDVTVIAAKVPGFIARLAATDNQSVSAGDLLIKLDDRDYRALLAKA